MNFAYHLWVAFGTGTSGTLTISNGMVTVANGGQFGLNWHNYADATATCNVYGGTLQLSNWADNQAIGANSASINIAGGTVIISGNHTNSIRQLRVSQFTIVAYGGSGTLQYDYGVSNPNMTTLTASNGSATAPNITDLTVNGGTVNITCTTTPGTTYPR